jgi:ATP-dependent exoDNAse (exonuclease V) alpha subunit
MIKCVENNDHVSAFKNKLKSIQDITKQDQDLIISFNGELTKALIFSQIINKINDDEIKNMCVLMFPKIFMIESAKLKVNELKIRTIEFTKDQKIGCRKFVEFMVNPNKKTFGLYGFSGTGKTTTLVEIVTYLLSNKMIKSIVFFAPTNKAVNVMKNKFEKYIREIYSTYSGAQKTEFIELSFEEIMFKLGMEYNVIIEFSTIHKLLNFDFDFDNDGKLCFKKAHESDMWKYDLVVIDECSMLPAQMVDYIFSDIRINKKNIKMVFSGDIAQLPPVNEKNSVIFSKSNEDYPFESYLESYNLNDADEVKKTCFKTKYDQLISEITKMDNFVMKQVVRSRSGNVLGVCNIIRDWALENIDKFQIGKFIDSIDCNAYKYTKYSKKTASEWFKKFVLQCKKKQDAIILTWTNKQCDEYNDAIRKELFKKQKSDNFESESQDNKLDSFLVGDVLMLNDFYNMKTNKEDDNNKFYTSEQIKVINVEVIDKILETFPSSLNKKSQKLENAKVYEECYKSILEKIIPNIKKSYKCWKLSVKRLSSRNDELCIIYVIHEIYTKTHEAEKEYISNQIKKMRAKLVAKYKEKSSVIDTHIIKHLWKSYHSIYVQPFANVNYGYCITCHKAQGSTFYNVFVDLEDIVKNTNNNEMKRCLYTAVSRTSNELHLLI